MNRALHADYDMPRKYAEGREWEICLASDQMLNGKPAFSKTLLCQPYGVGSENIPKGNCPEVRKSRRYWRRARRH